jgi:tetratricopeptide (TPR) repeat protein
VELTLEATPDTAREEVFATLVEGANLQQTGQFAAARVKYASILARQPNNPDALHLLGILAHQEGENERAAALIERAIISNGEHPDYHTSLGVVLAVLGRGEEAKASLEKALCLRPDHAEAQRHLEQIKGEEKATGQVPDQASEAGPEIGIEESEEHYHRASEYNEQGKVSESIRYYRRALACWEGNEGARTDMMAVLARIRTPAVLGDFTNALATDDLRPYLLVACMPKSGSTFLKNALLLSAGIPERMLSFAYMQNEQELHLPHVVAAAREVCVTQQHCRATDANIMVMQAFRIHPVVLVRNLFDIVASLYDFYDKGALPNTFFESCWPVLDRKQRLDLIIDHVVPWYVQFYVSWFKALEQRRLEGMWLSYEELMADKPALVARVHRFVGLDIADSEVARAVTFLDQHKDMSRWNKGVSGRGRTTLDEAQKQRIRALAAYFPDVDFSRIGL